MQLSIIARRRVHLSYLELVRQVHCLNILAEVRHVAPVISDEPTRNHWDFHPGASNCLEGTTLRYRSQLRKKLLILSFDSCRVFATRAARVDLLLALSLLGFLGSLLFQLDLLETCRVWDAARMFGAEAHLLVGAPVSMPLWLFFACLLCIHVFITSIV